MQTFDYDKNYRYKIRIEHVPTGKIYESNFLVREGVTMEKVWAIVQTEHMNIGQLPLALFADADSGGVMSIPAPILRESVITIEFEESDED